MLWSSDWTEGVFDAVRFRLTFERGEGHVVEELFILSVSQKPLEHKKICVVTNE